MKLEPVSKQPQRVLGPNGGKRPWWTVQLRVRVHSGALVRGTYSLTRYYRRQREAVEFLTSLPREVTPSDVDWSAVIKGLDQQSPDSNWFKVKTGLGL